MPTFTIYSIGDSAFLEQIFIAIAMISGTADFERMVGIGLLLGVFATAAHAIMQGGQSFPLQNVFVGFILYLCMFGPSTTVSIEDAYTGDVRVVANVPIGPAAAGGIISHVGYKLTTLFEVGYSPIIPKITENTFADSLKLLNDVRNVAHSSLIWDAMNIDAGGGYVDLRRSWNNYIQECTLTKIDLGLASADDIFHESYSDALKFSNSVFGTKLFLSATDQTGTNYTCANGWTALTANTQLNTPATINALNTLMLDQASITAGKNAITEAGTALQALTASTANATDYMKAAILEKIYIQAASGKYTELQDYSSATMINQALQQRNTQWAAEQTMFMTIVRPMITFFEGFIYAVTPIMAFIIVFGQKGIQLAGKYFAMILWIQLWMPVLSIINLYIHTAASGQMSSYEANLPGFNWDSFYALSESTDILQHWIATGGLLAASTPAIALMLVYGSAVTATHLAGRLKGGDFIDEKQQTPDLVKGGPLLQSNQGFQADAIGGVMRSGQQVQSLQWGSMAGQLTSSANQAVSSQTKSLISSIGKSLSENDSSSVQASKLHSIANAFESSSGDAKQWLNESMDKISQGYSYDKKHEESIKGVLAGTATGAISAQKGAGMLEKFLTKTGGTNPNASGSLSGSGQLSDTINDSKTMSQSDLTELTTGFKNTDSQTAAFGKKFAEQLQESSSSTNSYGWQGTSASNEAEQLSNAYSTQEQYSQMASRAASFGLTGSQTINSAAGNILNNNEAKQSLNNSYRSLMESDSSGLFKSHYQSALNKYASDAYSGGDLKRSSVMAAIETMSNPLAFSDQNRANSGIEGIMRSMSLSLGSAGFGITPGNENSNQDLTNSEGPSNPDLADVTKVGGKSFDRPTPPPSEISEDKARSDFQTNSDKIEASGSAIQNDRNREEALRLAANYNAENKHGSDSETSNAAYLSGAVKNTAENITNGAGYAFGGAFAFLDGAAKEISTWKDGLGDINSDPQRLQNFQEHYDQKLQDRYGDSPTGQMLKALNKGYDSATGLAGDLLFEDKPEGMSYNDYGAYLTEAASYAAVYGGASEANKYWDDLSERIYANYHEQAAEDFKLPDAQAHYYASSMTSNIGQSITSAASGIAETLGYGPDVADSRIYDGKMTEAYNSMKLEAAPKVLDENTGKMVADPNSYSTETINGREVITLNNKTMDDFVNNAADDINAAGYTGEWAENQLLQVKAINSRL